MNLLSRLLISAGVFLIIAGLIVLVIEKTGIKRLPLDMLVHKGNMTFFFPLGTSLLISFILTVILNLFSRK